MIFNIISVFPKIIKNYVKISKIYDLIQSKNVKFRYKNLLNITSRIDDKIYGGGSGMLIKSNVIFNALSHVKQKGLIIYLSPQGKIIDEKLILFLIKNYESFTFICSRYEGIDCRINKYFSPLELSIGDYVLFDGDTAALVIINLLIRYKFLSPCALNNESLKNDLLECDHYTRPETWKNISVPKILLSGNHKLIQLWRDKNAIYNTITKRKDIYIKRIDNE